MGLVNITPASSKVFLKRLLTSMSLRRRLGVGVFSALSKYCIIDDFLKPPCSTGFKNSCN